MWLPSYTLPKVRRRRRQLDSIVDDNQSYQRNWIFEGREGDVYWRRGRMGDSVSGVAES